MSEATKAYYYQKRLREELMERIDRNPRYSLRSFASALGLGSSALSQILAGKRSVSTKLVDRILNYLELDPEEQKAFLESILEEKKQKGLKRVSPELTSRLKQAAEAIPERSTRGVGLDEFRVIADWYHYAILELTFAKNFKADPRWIAKTLNIGVTEAKLALERLIDLELLEKKDGTYRKAVWNIDVADKTKTTAFHRKRQKQILEKSIHSLENDPMEERYHGGVTFCLDPKNIPTAKAQIQKVIWDLSQELVKGTPERVYELTVNLFPLQNKENSK